MLGKKRGGWGEGWYPNAHCGNVVPETSKVVLNDIFAELDGSSGIKNIITDTLNLGKLQVDEEEEIYRCRQRNIYQLGKLSFSVDIFSVFSVRIAGGGYQQFFDCWSCIIRAAAGFWVSL